MVAHFRWVLIASSIAAALSAQAKRPLSHSDYDSLKGISTPKLSPDGRWLEYGLFPQAGDGEAVIRDLSSGKEIRETAGSRPEPAADPDSDAPPTPRGLTVEFSADSKFAIFSTFPSKAETEKAHKEKKKPADMLKGGLAIVNLASGGVTRVAGV